MSRRAPLAIILSALLGMLPARPVAADAPRGRSARWSPVDSGVVNVNAEALATDALTVVTFNMLHGFGSRTNDATLEDRLLLLAEGIAACVPDVVILQEASLTPGRHGNVAERLRDILNGRLAARGISYNSVVAMANGSPLIGFHEGSAILSRWRILSADVLAYRSQALFPPERRIALRARIATAPAVGLQRHVLEVVGTHLTNTGARCGGRLRRTMQAGELAALLAGTGGGPAVVRVVGGDFNDLPGSDTIRALTSAGLRDSWLEAGQEGPGFTSLDGHLRDPGATAHARIDYIFVGGPGARVKDARPFLGAPGQGADGAALWASDHVGVAAVILLR